MQHRVCRRSLRRLGAAARRRELSLFYGFLVPVLCDLWGNLIAEGAMLNLHLMLCRACVIQ